MVTLHFNRGRRGEGEVNSTPALRESVSQSRKRCVSGFLGQPPPAGHGLGVEQERLASAGRFRGLDLSERGIPAAIITSAGEWGN